MDQPTAALIGAAAVVLVNAASWGVVHRLQVARESRQADRARAESDRRDLQMVLDECASGLLGLEQHGRALLVAVADFDTARSEIRVAEEDDESVEDNLRAAWAEVQQTESRTFEANERALIAKARLENRRHSDDPLVTTYGAAYDACLDVVLECVAAAGKGLEAAEAQEKLDVARQANSELNGLRDRFASAVRDEVVPAVRVGWDRQPSAPGIRR